jgi:hypothetical protein
MSPPAPDATTPVHRARLFPLQHLPGAVCVASTERRPARCRQRWRLQRTIVLLTNRCISTLNTMYGPAQATRDPLFKRPEPAAVSPSAVPPVSAAQARLQAHLRARCAAFVSKRRVGLDPTSPECDLGTMLSIADHVSLSERDGAHNTVTHQQHSPLSSLPRLSLFSTDSVSVVPLRASRVSLPDALQLVPITDVLPPDVAARYSHAAQHSLMRDPAEVAALNALQPLKPPRIGGSRAEYVRLIGRMLRLGMVAFTARPLAVNGVFTVAKDAESDRVIIDAQPANRLFVDSPRVELPSASHLIQMRLPPDTPMFSAKSDLSNYYHHNQLPEWMRPYFALPALTADELSSLSLPSVASVAALHPMCVSMPMGWSHAVFVAQSAHEHIVYRSGALQRCDSLLASPSQSLDATRCVHGIYVDDLFLFGRSRVAAEAALRRVLAAYAAAGFVVKNSKLVWPTRDVVRVLGFDVDGRDGSIAPSGDTVSSLLRGTLDVLRRATVSGRMLSRLVGSWTWVLMLRRPALAVLQHCYRYVDAAGTRPFTLWPSVRTELRSLVSLLPLLHASLTAPSFSRAIASDASELAAGVVSAPLSVELESALRDLCCTKEHAHAHAIAHSESLPADALALQRLRSFFVARLGVVSRARWSTVLSAAWRAPEHINALELRAAVLALHWLLSHPSAPGRRCFLLLDSLVALYVLWKGRSSSPSLLLIARKANALLLAGGVQLLPGWLPSASNPADAPSRLNQIGAQLQSNRIGCLGSSDHVP